MDNHDFDKSEKEINLYPIVDDSGDVKYVDVDQYEEYCKSHYIRHINDKDTNSMNEKMNCDNLDEFKKYIQKRVDDIESKESNIHEDFQYENYDDFIKSVQEEVRGTFEKENKTESHEEFTKSVWEEIKEIFEYKDENKDYESPYIQGTKIIKPLDRYDVEKESIYDTYEDYLSEYFSRETFSTDIFDQDSPYISGTNILKPRQRRVYETSEEYERFLKYYYDSHFNLENFYSFPSKEQRSKHQVVNHRRDILYKFRKKILICLTFIMVTLATIFGLKGNKSKDANSNQNIHQTVENVADDVEQFSEDVQKDIAREVERIMNSKNNIGNTKASTSTVGDVIKLKKNTIYYYDAQMSKPTGSIGNIYSPKSSRYIVDGIALINKKNNRIIVTGYEAGLSAKEMMKMYGLEKDDCRVMYHISINHDKLQLNSNKASQRGWVKFEKDNYRLKKNITKQSKSYVKRKTR